MTLETLVSCVQKNTDELAEIMNLDSDAIVINQCHENAYNEYEYKGHRICCYSFAERGVGLSRNNALLRAKADIILFSDEDIRYEDGYADVVIREFEKRPEADMLLFNFEVCEDRRTYHTEKETRVGRLNCGRYPTYSFAVRRERLHKAGVTFSLLFGGGAPYSNGEDSLFIRELIRKGFKIVALPVTLGREEPRPSTWFTGYNEKFFYDRGVLYKPLYGRLAGLMALRFVLLKQKMFFTDNDKVQDWKQAYRLMKKGIRDY